MPVIVWPQPSGSSAPPRGGLLPSTATVYARDWAPDASGGPVLDAEAARYADEPCRLEDKGGGVEWVEGQPVQIQVTRVYFGRPLAIANGDVVRVTDGLASDVGKTYRVVNDQARRPAGSLVGLMAGFMAVDCRAVEF